MFLESLKSIARDPTIGRQTNDGKARIKKVGHYLMLYDFNSSDVIIVSIWDSRREEIDSGFKYSF